MGHIGKPAMDQLAKSTNCLFNTYRELIKLICEICIQQNLARKPSYALTNKPTKTNEKISSDLAEPIKLSGLNSERYFISFLDSTTRYLDFACLKIKN